MTLMKREWRPESTIYLHFYALFMTDTVRVRRESERARARERERERDRKQMTAGWIRTRACCLKNQALYPVSLGGAPEPPVRRMSHPLQSRDPLTLAHMCRKQKNTHPHSGAGSLSAGGTEVCVHIKHTQILTHPRRPRLFLM